MQRALTLRMDASWSLLHQPFYDALSGGYDNKLERQMFFLAFHRCLERLFVEQMAR